MNVYNEESTLNVDYSGLRLKVNNFSLQTNSTLDSSASRLMSGRVYCGLNNDSILHRLIVFVDTNKDSTAELNHVESDGRIHETKDTINANINAVANIGVNSISHANGINHSIANPNQNITPSVLNGFAIPTKTISNKKGNHEQSPFHMKPPPTPPMVLPSPKHTVQLTAACQ